MIDGFFCVFYEGHNPAESQPVATFDRMQFLVEFLNARSRSVRFREQDDSVKILTVAEWRWLVVQAQEKKDFEGSNV